VSCSNSVTREKKRKTVAIPNKLMAILAMMMAAYEIYYADLRLINRPTELDFKFGSNVNISCLLLPNSWPSVM